MISWSVNFFSSDFKHSSNSILFLTPRITELTFGTLSAYLWPKSAGLIPQFFASSLNQEALSKSSKSFLSSPDEWGFLSIYEVRPPAWTARIAKIRIFLFWHSFNIELQFRSLVV